MVTRQELKSIRDTLVSELTAATLAGDTYRFYTIQEELMSIDNKLLEMK
jgi:hypothetical protein